MLKRLLPILLVFACISTANAAAFKIAALVNGDIISNEDLSDQRAIFMLNSPIPYNEQTKDMINDRVLAQTIEQKIKSLIRE